MGMRPLFASTRASRAWYISSGRTAHLRYNILKVPSAINTNVLSSSAFRLGEWVVEPLIGRLTRGGTTIGLELKVMDVLLCLAMKPGLLVTRQDLIDTVEPLLY
jgi:DNA-binding response OmpR family regulator